MPYPYSWKPTRITPLTESQVGVFNADGTPATLAVPVSIMDGTIFFELADFGSYYIEVRFLDSRELGRFTVDLTGIDTSEPEYVEYEGSSPQQPTNIPGTAYVTREEMLTPTSDIRKSITADIDSRLALALAVSIAL